MFAPSKKLVALGLAVAALGGSGAAQAGLGMPQASRHPDAASPRIIAVLKHPDATSPRIIAVLKKQAMRKAGGDR